MYCNIQIEGVYLPRVYPCRKMEAVDIVSDEDRHNIL